MDKKEKNLFTEYEPKRKNRFLIEFPSVLDIEPFLVKKCDLPKYCMSGKWVDMNIEFNELVAISTADILIKLMAMKLFSFKILLLDPTGVVVEKWEIFIDKIISVNFGSVDLSSDELSTSTMTIKPSHCVLIK